MIKSGIFSQYYAAICANMLTVVYGISVGWPSSSLPMLKAEDTSIIAVPLTFIEASIAGSVICLGGAIGTPLYGVIADKLGRKPGIFLSFVPIIISWLLIEFGQEFYSVLSARLVVGLAGGAAYQVIPMIITEIADDSIRGTLGSMLMLSQNVGCIIGYVLCSYLSYHTVPWIAMGLAFVAMAGYSIVPETPKYLLMVHKKEEAIKALGHFKGPMYATEESLKKYSQAVGGDDDNNSGGGLSFSDFCTPATKKGIVIGCILMNLVCFAGAFVLSNYYETIFREAGSSLSPAMSSIIVACIQFSGTYCATMTIERAGRKLLVLTSAYGAAACLAIMGLYAFLRASDVDVSAFMWVPLVSLSGLAFIASNGATCVPFVIMGEIYAQNVRSAMISFCMLLNWIVTFLVVLGFPYMMEYLKMYGALWVFVVVETFLATALLIVLPETKGLSVERIVEILGGSPPTDKTINKA